MKPYVAEIHEAEGSDGSFRIVISNGRIQLADLRAPSRSDAERISAELMRRFHEIERNWPWMRG
ncbi:MAG: hypothetical protein DI605_06365 [Sphingomonas sp.]|nr:MAG: hypothetical protein DI605_06365 [Sphingomonas sp.]